MTYITPSISDFKDHFFRDFPYDETGQDMGKVQDRDIAKAIAEASVNFNEALWETQDTFSLAFLYLAAHYLVVDLRASSSGLSGSYDWQSTSKTVGNVSESFAIPERIMRSPYLSVISTTNYGAKYLSLIAPRIVGNFMVVEGFSTP